MVLPPGVNSADFSTALEQFENAVGEDWVFTSDEDVTLYRDAYSPFWEEEEELVASAAVAPDTVEQVQAIVRIANQYKVPLYPISTGKNLGYGGSAPVLSGSVVLDLKRMNRVLEVNERNATALVEPGVSYFDLYRYIQERGLKVWIDTPDPGWGSPIGNSLDHGVGYTMAQYRDHFNAHCGMEVVLSNGEVMRTGMGALPGAKSWQEYPYGYGPYIDGLFSQSNLGVVTKMGFWLMPEPEAYRDGTVLVPRHRDLIPLIDILSKLSNAGIVNGRTSLESPLLAGRCKPEGSLSCVFHEAMLAQPGGPPLDQLESFGLANDIPYWTCRLRFYGPEKVISAQWEYAREQYTAIPGAKFEDGPSYRFPLTLEQQAAADHIVDFGIPNLSVFRGRSETNPSPSKGHMWFAPVIPKTGEAVFEAQRVFTEAFAELGLPYRGFSSLPETYFARSFTLIYSIPISDKIEKNRKNRAAVKRLIEIAAEHGWGQYRTPPAFMDDVMNSYSYNNHVLRRFHETVKDAIDPNGIISAGRSGIWPKQFRKTQV